MLIKLQQMLPKNPSVIFFPKRTHDKSACEVTQDFEAPLDETS